jgi:hypothetical protein
MGRYHAQFTTAAAPAVGFIVGSIACVAGGGFNLKRVDASLATIASASAPPDQNCTLGIALITAAGTGGITAPTVTPLNQNYPAATCLAAVTYATTQPTIGATGTDPYMISCSSRGGGILNWEQPDEWQALKGAANGIAFVNRINALTTPLAWVVDVEWEE